MTLSRRDFNLLSAAALGGILSGCQSSPKGEAGAQNLLTEPHVCKGLNTCSGKGGCTTASNDCTGKNTCAGAGGCPTVAAHECRGTNDCAGQGGCGDHPGENGCKGLGECAVPLSDKAWTKARANFEKAMATAGKTVNPAPAKS